MAYLHSPPLWPGSLLTVQLLGRVGKWTSPKAIRQLAQGDTEKLRSSPHGCELVSLGGWLIDDSGTLHLTNTVLVGIFVWKTSVYGVSALGARDKTD